MKMHTLSCKDLGNPVCDYVASAGSDAEVKRKMLDHAAKAHPDAVATPEKKDALSRTIDRVLEDKADGAELEETHGAHGRYGMEEEKEDESQGGEFLGGIDEDGDEDESPRGGSARASRATQHARGAGDESEARRDADRDAETRRTGEDLR